MYSKYVILLLPLTIILQPAFAERFVSYQDTVDMNKNTFLDVITHLQDYPRIFPQYVKSVNVLGDGTADIQIVSSAYNDDLQVKYYSDPQGKFVLEPLSGKAKGSKMIITLTPRYGYDGTPNGGTIVKTDLTLDIGGFFESIALGFVSDRDIQNGIDTALYDFEKFAKEKYPQSKNPRKDIVQEQKSTSPVNLQKKVVSKDLGTVKKPKKTTLFFMQ